MILWLLSEAFICKHFYALTFIKEINFDCNLSKQADNNTFKFIKVNKTKDQITKEHKLYFSKYRINLNYNMQDFHLMYWISKTRKNPVSFRFIISSPVWSFKLLSKDITSIFLSCFSEKWKDIIQKKKDGQESRSSGLFRIAIL